MDNKGQELLAGLTLFGVAAGMLDRVLPPVHEVRKKNCEAADVQDIRRRVGRTSAILCGLGAGVSLVLKSPYPILGVTAACLWLTGEYEAAAKAPGDQQVQVLRFAGM